jgi:hypothetical protein
MAYSVQHAQCKGARPYWYQLEAYSDREKAMHRARNYALDNGGYVCVKDASGKTIWGSDPGDLERSIASGSNHYWRAPHVCDGECIMSNCPPVQR